MKKFIILILAITFVSTFVSCDFKGGHLIYRDSYPAQQYFNEQIRKSEITDSLGHMYYMYEVGTRGSNNYSFDLEHRIDCKKCLDIFD